MQNRQALQRIPEGNNEKIHKRRSQVSPFFPIGFKLDSLNPSKKPKNSSSLLQSASWRNINNTFPTEKRNKSPSKVIEGDIISKAVEAYYGAKSRPITAEDFENESFSSKIIVDQIKGDLLMTRKMTMIRTNTSKNIAALNNILVRVSTSDSRETGVGSRGGHIAREVKSPGPHNGHNPPQKPHLFLATEVVLLPKPILYAKEPLIQPVWDHRFTEGKMLSPSLLSEGPGGNSESVSEDTNSSSDRPHTTGKINKATLFRQEILKSRDLKRRHSASSESYLSKEKVMTNSELEFNLVALPAAPLDFSENESHKSATSLQEYTLGRRLRPRGKIPLIVIAQKLWNTLSYELQESGNEITKGDLAEVHQYVAPPSDAVIIMGFICTLMEIETSWAEAKNVLLSDYKVLCSYFAEIDPLSIPHKKLRAVLRYKNVQFPQNNPSFGIVSKPMAKLTRWTMAFSNMAALIISLVDKMESLDAVSSWISVDASASASGDQDEGPMESLKMSVGRWEDASSFCHTLAEDKELLHEWVDFDISMYQDDGSLHHSNRFIKDSFPDKSAGDKEKSMTSPFDRVPPGDSVFDTGNSSEKSEIGLVQQSQVAEVVEGEGKTAFEYSTEPAFTVSINKVSVNVLQADKVVPPKDLYISMNFTGLTWAAKTFSIVALSSFVTWDFMAEDRPTDMELSSDNLDKGLFHVRLYADRGDAHKDQLLGVGSISLSRPLNSVAVADNAVIEIMEISSPNDSSSIIGMVTCFFSVVRLSGTMDSGHGCSEVSDTADLLSHLSISTTQSDDGSLPSNTPENNTISNAVSPLANPPVQEDATDSESHPTTTHDITTSSETAIAVQLTFDDDMLTPYCGSGDDVVKENDWKEKSSRERLQDLQERLHPNMSMNIITEDNELDDDLQISPDTLQQSSDKLDTEQQSIEGFIFDNSDTSENDNDRLEFDVDEANVTGDVPGVSDSDSADKADVNAVPGEETTATTPTTTTTTTTTTGDDLNLTGLPVAIPVPPPPSSSCLFNVFPTESNLVVKVHKIIASKLKYFMLMGQSDSYITVDVNNGYWKGTFRFRSASVVSAGDEGGSALEWTFDDDTDPLRQFDIKAGDLNSSVIQFQAFDSDAEDILIGAGEMAVSSAGSYEAMDGEQGLLNMTASLTDTTGLCSGVVVIQFILRKRD